MRGARKLIELYNKWTGKTGKFQEIMYRKSAREREGEEQRGDRHFNN